MVKINSHNLSPSYDSKHLTQKVDTNSKNIASLALIVKKNGLQIDKNSLQIEKNSLQIKKNGIQIEKNGVYIAKLMLAMKKNSDNIEKNREESRQSIRDLGALFEQLRHDFAIVVEIISSFSEKLDRIVSELTATKESIAHRASYDDFYALEKRVAVIEKKCIKKNA